MQCFCALGGLAVVGLKKGVGMLADAFAIEMECYNEADVIDDVVEKVEFEGA